MRTLYLVSVWLHIVAAMAWVGGMLFLVTVLVPLLRTPAMRPQAAELFNALGRRFRIVGWVAIGTLVVTGLFNVTMRETQAMHGHASRAAVARRVFVFSSPPRRTTLASRDQGWPDQSSSRSASRSSNRFG